MIKQTEKKELLGSKNPEGSDIESLGVLENEQQVGQREADAQLLEEQITDRVVKIEAGQAPAVDPKILQQARESVSHETGGVNIPRAKAELQSLLEMLQGGDAVKNDPAAALDSVLSASENRPTDPSLN